MYGRHGKTVWVDLDKSCVKEYPVLPEIYKGYIGGSGLAARIVYDHTRPDTDPLGPGNVLVFATGPFTNTPVPTSGRHQVAARSPLTGLWGESDAGGHFGVALKASGYDALVVTGRAQKPVVITLSPAGASIEDGSALWGCSTSETDDALRLRHGKSAQICSIGPAGERLVRFACIINDGVDGRAAGRTGMGAVMGAKRLKAVVAEGNTPTPVFDKEALLSAVREANRVIRRRTESLGQYGSAGAISAIEAVGDLPVKNWQIGSWPEGAHALSGQEMARKVLTGRFHCGSCPIGCGRRVKATTRWGSVEGAGYEYETAAMFGANLLIDDMDAVLYANRLANEYGLDTISCGAAVAFAFECYGLGLITEADTGGVPLQWGDGNALVEMVRMIGGRERIGYLLGEGVRRAAEALGPVTSRAAVHSRGLELPAHDPRAYSSLGVAYATSSRGACHLQGFSHLYEAFLTMPELGMTEVFERFTPRGKGDMVKKLQDLMAVFDSLKLCKYLTFAGVPLADIRSWLYLVTGEDWSQEELMLAGERICNLKRVYKLSCGSDGQDDTLPERILRTPRGSGGSPSHLPPLDEMLEEYYASRGWDERGRPTAETIERLLLTQRQPWF
ncbi:MAG: aldehyde ferredoxin oxidoreductase family protein [Bacillota bacterium]